MKKTILAACIILISLTGLAQSKEDTTVTVQTPLLSVTHLNSVINNLGKDLSTQLTKAQWDLVMDAVNANLQKVLAEAIQDRKKTVVKPK